MLSLWVCSTSRSQHLFHTSKATCRHSLGLLMYMHPNKLSLVDRTIMAPSHTNQEMPAGVSTPNLRGSLSDCNLRSYSQNMVHCLKAHHACFTMHPDPEGLCISLLFRESLSGGKEMHTHL